MLIETNGKSPLVRSKPMGIPDTIIYRVRHLIQSAIISLITEANSIKNTFQIGQGYSLTPIALDHSQIFWSSLSTASI